MYSEYVDNYSKVVEKEMNYKKFKKALKTLNSLNLIIYKRNSDYIELHPLVKEFIKLGHKATLITSESNHFAKYPETDEIHNFEIVEDLPAPNDWSKCVCHHQSRRNHQAPSHTLGQSS